MKERRVLPYVIEAVIVHGVLLVNHISEAFFKKDWFKTIKIPFWIRLLLRFKPTYMSVDMATVDGKSDYTVLWYKSHKGRIYIKKIQHTETLDLAVKTLGYIDHNIDPNYINPPKI